MDSVDVEALLYQQLHQPTAINSAAVLKDQSGSYELVVNRHTCVEVWRHVLGELHCAVTEELYEGAELIINLASEEFQQCRYFLLLSADDKLHLVHCQGVQLVNAGTVQLQRPADESSATRRLLGPCTSQAQYIAATNETIVALTLYGSSVTLVHVVWPASPALRSNYGSSAAAQPRPRLYCSNLATAEGCDLTKAQGGVSATSLSFVPGHSAFGTADRRHVLALLRSVQTTSASALTICSAAIDLTSDTAHPGPWALRNIDVSTTVLWPVAPCQPAFITAGLLLVSSNAATMVPVEPSQGRQINVPLELQGTPACMAQLAPGLYVVADSAAGLHLVDLRAPPGLARRLAVAPPAGRRAARLSLPSLMQFLPGWTHEAAGDAAGLLFVGSDTCSSQFLAVPAAVMAAAPVPAEGLRWSLVDPAFIDSLAPVASCAHLAYSAGCSSEGRLLVCCGAAPRGRLCLAQLAVNLRATILSGPCIEGAPSMFVMEDVSGDGYHDYLVFSFLQEGCSTVLDITGTHFEQVAVPGFCCEAATLLAGRAPGGWLVQVTPKEVRVISKETGLVSRWESGGTLHAAAAHGQIVAVACAATVHCLQVDAGSGQLQTRDTEQYAQQVSALALLALPGAAGQEQLWLAVGQWLTNEVLLRRLDGRPESTASLVVSAQPRSLLAAQMQGSWYLCVGTAAGELVVYHLPHPSGTELQLGDACCLQVGASTVELQYVPARCGNPAHVIAQADQGLVLRVAPPHLTTGGDLGALEAVRMHGSVGLRGLVALHTRHLPAAAAWLARSGRLVFGTLEQQCRLRWSTAAFDDTPTHVAHHSASGCAALLTEDQQGASWLRLVCLTSLHQVAAVQLAPGHRHTALHVDSCACSSAPAPDSAGSVRATSQAAGKQFVMVASYIADQRPGCSMEQTETGSQPGPGQRGAAASVERVQGLLSVFEVLCTPASEAQRRYKLVLHGTCALPGVAYTLASLAAAQPQASAGTSLLAAGCHDGVHLFSLHVDDGAQEGQRAVNGLLDAVAGPEDLPSGDTQEDGPELTARISGVELGQAEAALQRAWPQRMTLTHLGRADATGGAAITGLACAGTMLAAAEFLGGLALFQLEGDRLQARAVDARAAAVQALAALSDRAVLAGLHPAGLLLLGRDAQTEAAYLDALHRQAQAAAERGQTGAAVAPVRVGDQQVPAAALGLGDEPAPSPPRLPRLAVLAAARPPGVITQLCHGFLGIRMQPLPPASAGAPGPHLGRRGSLLYVTAGGALGALHRLAPSEWAQLAPLLAGSRAAAGLLVAGDAQDCAGSRRSAGWRWSCLPHLGGASAEEDSPADHPAAAAGPANIADASWLAALLAVPLPEREQLASAAGLAEADLLAAQRLLACVLRGEP